MAKNVLNVRSNIKEFTRHLDDIAKRQIPYATSQALNDTAFGLRGDSIANAKAKLQTRNGGTWTNPRTGFHVKKSTKRDLTADVHALSYYAVRQEFGEKKVPRFGKFLAVPAKGSPKKFYKSTAAREEMGQPRTFINKGTKTGNLAIMRRKSAATKTKGGKSRGGRYPVKVLFYLVDSADVQPRMGFYALANAVAERKLMNNFSKRFDQAMRTAR